eukprot:TRINITY_DN3198_c0_g1_i11.p3 TRINITY_DN3198_c0_g1~~TRINITY_DN3198_c0_g1_i11.p3  ORF type:complete len:101 (-),score=27.61 TRINITY_DN3198_c0_g1_i11:250-552(-)
MLEFLREKLSWRYSRTMSMDEVKEMKAWCLEEPENYLWCGSTRRLQEVRNIFHSIRGLKYGDRPDYKYVREQLKTLLQREEATCSPTIRELTAVRVYLIV